MSARPLDLDVLSSRLLTLDERDALIHYCRTARAAIEDIRAHGTPGVEHHCWPAGECQCRAARALRDLDAIAGDAP